MEKEWRHRIDQEATHKLGAIPSFLVQNKMLQIKPNMPDVVIDKAFTLPIFTVYLQLRRSKGRRGRVKALFNGNELNVEPAIRQILEQLGYEVLNGDQVHEAGLAVIGETMNGDETFMGWARHYGYGESYLHRVLNEADQRLESYLKGNRGARLGMLESLIERWDIYNNPVPERKREIRVLTEFWEANPELFDRWFRRYTRFAGCDPGGAPDLFAWDRQTNEWSWIEVKSPNDNLREEQWLWIQLFIVNVAPNVAIARILEPEARLCPNDEYKKKDLRIFPTPNERLRNELIRIDREHR